MNPNFFIFNFNFAVKYFSKPILDITVIMTSCWFALFFGLTKFLQNRAIILSNGKIIASGSPKEVISDRDAKTQYFGDEFNIS